RTAKLLIVLYGQFLFLVGIAELDEVFSYLISSVIAQIFHDRTKEVHHPHLDIRILQHRILDALDDYVIVRLVIIILDLIQLKIQRERILRPKLNELPKSS